MDVTQLHVHYRKFNVLLNNIHDDMMRLKKTSMGNLCDCRNQIERIYSTTIKYIQTLNLYIQYNTEDDTYMHMELRRKFIYLLYSTTELFEKIKSRKIYY